MTEKLENKLKFDWQEMIPFFGVAKCLCVNFDFAKEKGYVGFGGQFKKHIEQTREHGLTSSIPANIILYTFYQATSLYPIFNYFFK